MALRAEALTRVAPDPTTTCRAGLHLLTADNLAWDASGRDGVRRPRCLACKRETVRRSRAKNSPATTTTMIMPRLTRSGQVVVKASETYATARLFGLLPKPLRDRVAGAVMDERIDRLQRRVLERCADQRAWAATGEDMAVRLYLEALLSQTIDARSSLLRMDRLLDLIFGP